MPDDGVLRVDPGAVRGVRRQRLRQPRPGRPAERRRRSSTSSSTTPRATWDTTLELVQDPTYVSWHYSLRSTDGHIAQHVKNKDVGLARRQLVRQREVDRPGARGLPRLAGRLVHGGDVPHVGAAGAVPRRQRTTSRWTGSTSSGHDTVPGPTTATIRGMHTDPGPYWDWAHYFELLGRPFGATCRRGQRPGHHPSRTTPTTSPRSPAARPAARPCAPHGSSAVRLYTAPDATTRP